MKILPGDLDSVFTMPLSSVSLGSILLAIGTCVLFYWLIQLVTFIFITTIKGKW